jgi:membrane associated rhomboid family serine protease
MAFYRYNRNHNVVLIIIAINILVFLVQQIFPDATFYAALSLPAVMHGWLWQFVTYMFAHGGISHLFFNMLALFIFGTQIENYLGTREFILYYLITGILAGVFSFFIFLLTGASRTYLLGASGAIFAVQLAFAVLNPRAVIYLWGLLPLRAPVMVLVFTAIELFSTVTGFNRGVAHFTHLAGFGFGWLYLLTRLKINPWKRLTGR